ncbi:MAG: sensor histidine kinase [Pseudobdellovibrionaceae bacterium]
MAKESQYLLDLKYSRKKYFYFGLSIIIGWSPWSLLNEYFFHAQDAVAFRFFLGFLGIGFALYAKSKYFNPYSAEWIMSLFFSAAFIQIVHAISSNNYRMLYVVGTMCMPVVMSSFSNTLKHFLLTIVPGTLLIPIFALQDDIPQEPWTATFFLTITVGVFLGYLIHVRVQDQNNLVLTMEKLGESERARLQSAKMASMGEMAGGIAHEINNPMSIITGKAGMILRWAEKNQLDPEKVKTSAQKIVEIVDRIGKITKGLLIFARNGENDPFRSCDLSVTIDNTVEMLREKAKGSHIEIEWQKPTSTMVDCRETQIAQTVINLLNNSVDALKRLEIEDKKIQVQLVVEETWCKLSVVDSGSGIAAPVVEKMFQPFFSTKEVGDGTGMGLSNSEGIARQHKGTLVYDNETGHTRFILKIPAKQEGALGLNEAEAIDPESAAFSGRPGGGAAA